MYTLQIDSLILGVVGVFSKYSPLQTSSNIAYMCAPGRAHQPALAPVPHHAGDLRPGEAHGPAGRLHPQHGAAPQGGADQARAQDLAAGGGGVPGPASPQVRMRD